MPARQVIPVLLVREAVDALCCRPYHGHPKGCPNFGKRPACPPVLPLLVDVLDFDKPIWVAWTTFDLGAHVERMRAKHPGWSLRQLHCCRYWQPMARRTLKTEYTRVLYDESLSWFTTCPEGRGVNVTATMRLVGVELEWPPETVTCQVALLGHRR